MYVCVHNVSYSDAVKNESETCVQMSDVPLFTPVYLHENQGFIRQWLKSVRFKQPCA